MEDGVRKERGTRRRRRRRNCLGDVKQTNEPIFNYIAVKKKRSKKDYMGGYGGRKERMKWNSYNLKKQNLQG